MDNNVWVAVLGAGFGATLIKLLDAMIGRYYAHKTRKLDINLSEREELQTQVLNLENEISLMKEVRFVKLERNYKELKADYNALKKDTETERLKLVKQIAELRTENTILKQQVELLTSGGKVAS